MKTMKLLLGSGSPRRKELIEKLNWSFTRAHIECDESHPESLKAAEIALHLAEKKSLAFEEELQSNSLLLTADTVVWSKGRHLAKANNPEMAKQMLLQLSNSSHEVITGVCLRWNEGCSSFTESTKVFFKQLDEAEIDFYIEKYRPFDKAGAYGIQEWIGLVGIEKIEGCFYNVVGLPVQRLATTIKQLNFHIAP